MSKAQIITIAEIKGGTGKTTTAAAIAQAGALDNKRVLCIDLDAQVNLTALFGADPGQRGSYELLNGHPVQELIQHTDFNVDIIAGAPNLAAEIPASGSAYRLKHAIASILKSYDIIIIDTPPAFGEMTYNALQACTGVLVALDADTKALQGFYSITDLARAAKAKNKSLKLLGCIITRYTPRPKLSQKMRETIEEKAKALHCPLLGEIREGIAIKEAQAYGENLFTYAPKSKPAADYMEIYRKLFKEE